MSQQLASVLHRLDAVIRPLSGMRPTPMMKSSLFSSTLASTVNLLRTELSALDAEQVVLELDYLDRDLRMDGYPRAGAKAQSPAIALSFKSGHGPLRYPCATFGTWHDNLRAIALGLEALRKVDRYGITSTGEQYAGFRQIAQSSQSFTSREHALAWLSEHGGYKAAARTFHPDNLETGHEETFKQVQAAKQMIEA